MNCVRTVSQRAFCALPSMRQPVRLVTFCIAIMAVLVMALGQRASAQSGHAEWLRIYETSGQQYRSRQLAEAAVTAQQALEFARAYSGGPERQLLIAGSLERLADVRLAQGMQGQAEALLLEAVEAFDKALWIGEFVTNVPTTKLADLYRTQRRWATAVPYYQKSLPVVERQFGADHPVVLTVLLPLAHCLLEEQRNQEAESLYLRAIPLSEKYRGSDSPEVSAALNNLGLLYTRDKRYSEAEPLLLRSLTIKEKILPPQSLDIGITLNNIGLNYKQWGRVSDAEQMYLRALALFEVTLTDTHPQMRTTLRNLAELYKADGKPEKAKPFADRVRGGR